MDSNNEVGVVVVGAAVHELLMPMPMGYSKVVPPIPPANNKGAKKRKIRKVYDKKRELSTLSGVQEGYGTCYTNICHTKYCHTPMAILQDGKNTHTPNISTPKS